MTSHLIEATLKAIHAFIERLSLFDAINDAGSGKRQHSDNFTISSSK